MNQEVFKMTFKVARVAAGLRIEDACKGLDINRQKLIDIEKYRKAPTIELLERMAKLYGLPSWRAFAIPRYNA